MTTARALGMHVVLKPHVDVADGSFRGDIAPADPAAWFDAYRRMSDHYADLAAAGGAEMLIVGTELTSMSGYEGEWRRVIDGVRARFGGRLTFAANWVDGARRIGFWDALDFIGVDAYMPLATSSGSTVDELAAAWRDRGYVGELADLHARVGKPVLFTELGYQSRLDTAVTPWGGATEAIDQEAQARAYEAAYRAFWDAPWFAGIYWWDWSATGASDPGGHPFAGKAAEGIVRAWNATARPEPAPAPAPAPTGAPPAGAPAAGSPAPAPAPAVEGPARLRLRVWRGRRLDGTVHRGASPCPTPVTIRLRRARRGPRHASWRTQTAHATAAGNFRFALRRLRPGRYQADAVVRGACGPARSVKLAFRVR